MTCYICTTCGVQYEDAKKPPSKCLICTNDRQYTGWEGQQWTTLEKMKRRGFKNIFKTIRRGLHQIITDPSFAIGQRAFLVRAFSGNILWDCVAYLDDATVSRINRLGGLDCIALSHPHFYSSMVEWSEAFGGLPIYIHNLDRMWVQRRSLNIVYWKGRKVTPLSGAQVVNLGGHFDGSSALHLSGGDFQKGVLLSGDTIYVVEDRRWASFMYSYANLIPLPARKVKAIASRIRSWRFEDLYSGFEGREIIGGAGRAFQNSAKRYVNHLKNS